MIHKNEIEDVYELSPVQQGLLYHTLEAPGLGLYFEQFCWELRGRLDEDAFARASQEVMDRHPVLRTAFHWEELDKPLQLVHRRVALTSTRLDWRDVPPAMQDARWESFLREDRLRGFRLSEVPLMRAALIRLSEEVFRLVWSHHHLILDGWSASILFREIVSIYEAHRRGQPIDLGPAGRYRDYILWLLRQDHSRAASFWRRTLAGFDAPTPLGVDRDTGGGPRRDRGGDLDLDLSRATTAALLALGRRHQLTPNTLVQGAWALLLGSYSGEDDVVFGATVSGRSAPVPGIESMIGLFINTLPIRIRMAPDAQLLPWLKQLQDHQVELRQYESSPLVQVHGWSEVPRGQPLFRTILVFENYPVALVGAGDPGSLEVADVRVMERTNYALTILAGILGDALILRILYDECRFEEESVARMLGHLRTLLESFAADPGRPLRELSPLTAAERRRILVSWNETDATFPRQGLTLRERFEARAAATPDAVAVVFGDHRLTYLELNRRADRLAGRLRSLGVGPETCAGICIERSPAMVIAILSILKAGGAYVPLDPEDPEERLGWLIRDARAPIVITREQLAGRFADLPVLAIVVDADRASDEPPDANPPDPGASSNNLAYVMYTSGSTGRPKGVMISHGAVCNGLSWFQGVYRLGGGDAVLQSAPYTFDLSVWELFGPLLAGAQLVLTRAEDRGDRDAIVRLIADEQVTLAFFVPALLHQLLEGDSAEDWRSVRDVICTGDVLPAELQERLLSLRRVRLSNLYGPTEAAVEVTYWFCTSGAGSGIVPIGRPIVNTRAYVLDRRLRPVPVGVGGELYIAGANLARGYLHRPGATSERFLPDPFAREPGTRLYRTGDRARYRADGAIELLGRLDDQVKVRGHRIEPGEVESILLGHPDVLQAAVVVREDHPGDRHLVAYLVPRSGAAPRESELSKFAQGRLPAYLIPSRFVMMDALPLSANGKVDRRSLPIPGATRPEVTPDFVPPRTPIEEVVAGIWSEVLHDDHIGSRGHFFELGGHSLLATRVLSRVRRAFRVDLPLGRLFEEPTVAGLSRAIEEAMRDAQSPPLSPVRASRDGPLPLSFAQHRMWFLDKLEPRNTNYYLPWAFRVRGPLSVAALVRSLDAVVERHEALRTTFEDRDGHPAQRIAPRLRTPFGVVDLSLLPAPTRAAELGRVLAASARQPFDLTRGPLLRLFVVRLDREESAVLLAMHHIISDGWSMGVLIRELAACYEAFDRGRRPELPELPLQYADFATWQRDWLQGTELERQLAYWERQLADAPTVLGLPCDRPRPAVNRFRGATHRTQLSARLTDALRGLSRREEATLFMTLLAAFQTFLGRHAAQDDVVVGSPVANRRHLETEGLIGLFVNTLVLRTRLSDDPTFRALLVRVREVVVGASAHQDLPFEQLVDRLQPRRDLGRAPLFQVMFVFQDAPPSPGAFPGLELQPIDVHRGAAKFDLTLSMADAPGGLAGIWEYNTDLFDAATIEGMAGRFAVLLAGVVDDPDRRLSALPILTAAEERQLLIDWNDTRVDGPRERCLHELFEAQAEQTPDAIALTCGGAAMTYRALNRSANRLAHRMIRLGVGPDLGVGICMENAPELAVGILAILKAGGAYVPIDPSFPRDRLDFLMSDAEVLMLLTQRRLADRFPETAARRLFLDSADDIPADEPEDNPRVGVAPDHLAYVTYTSGATGRPKGVLIPHAAIANRLRWGQATYALSRTDRVLQATCFAFDFSVCEFFGTWLAGASLIVIPRADQRDPGRLVAVMAEEQASVVHFVPPFLEMVLEEPGLSACGNLRHVFSGGEALSTLTRDRCFESLPGALHNQYGPTEAAVDVASWTCRRGCDPHGVPIGRPISNTRLYILDAHLRPVPVGVEGELCIGGANLARGYHRRPDLTADRFVPDPFGPAPGARLYRTGDLARYRADGAVELLGRLDDQVKVRGHRIEPGEIEAVLAGHPDVCRSAVVVREDVPGVRRLVAYLVARTGREPTDRELRPYLQARLPAYMLPSTFLLVDAIPLTPAGKVDRRSLPSAPIHSEGRPELVAPRDHREELLAGLWADLLGLEEVGVHDNFFELGGDSLLCLQVIARARQAGLRLTVQEFFRRQTVAELASWARRSAPRVEDGRDAGDPVPLLPSQRWFFEQPFPEPHHFNIAILVESAVPISASSLELAMHRVLRHHDALRMRFVPDAGGWRQFDGGPDLPAAVNRVDLSALPEDRQGAALDRAVSASQGSLDLSQGPPIRIVLLHMGADGPDRVLVVIHHLVIDAVSWRIVLEDLQTAYRQVRSGEPVRLPPRTSSCQQWSRRLEARAQSDELRRELAYWLAGPCDRAAPLPVDFPGGANTWGSVRTISSAFGPEETQALLRAVPRAFPAQMQEILLTALALAFADWTGRDGLLIDLESHGREDLFDDLDVSRSVGWFNMYYPVYLEPGRGATPLSALRSVCATLRSVPGRGIGYGLLRYLCREADVVRALRERPQAEVSFNYLGRRPAPAPVATAFSLAGEPVGPLRDDAGLRSDLLEVGGHIRGGRLEIAWRYSANLHRGATIEQLAESFSEALRALIAEARTQQAGASPIAHAAAPAVRERPAGRLAAVAADASPFTSPGD